MVRMRVNRSHTGNRRSHHKVAEKRLSTCSCGAVHERHRACEACGKYRDKQAIDIVARTEREQRRAKNKQQEAREMGAQPQQQQPEEATAGDKKEESK